MPQQLELFPLASPCKGICQSNERGYCLGCMRSRSERFNWNQFNNSEKQEVLRLCRQRFNRLRRSKASGNSITAQQNTLF